MVMMAASILLVTVQTLLTNNCLSIVMPRNAARP